MSQSPAMSATEFESPIPIENDRQLLVVVTSSLSIAVPCIFVSLRLFAKLTRTSKPLDLADLCLMIALLVNIGLHIDYFLLVTKGGMGFKVAEILERFGPGVMIFFGKVLSSRHDKRDHTLTYHIRPLYLWAACTISLSGPARFPYYSCMRL